MLSSLWYRGVNKVFPTLVPGVYREDFTNRSQKLSIRKASSEAKCLRLEREMLAQFRSAGAVFLNPHGPVDMYFLAQHFGMPTRLLDWSTNPLAALFFACDGAPDQPGIVCAMDAKQTIPNGAVYASGSNTVKARKLSQSVMTMRHPFVKYSVGVSFWDPEEEGHGAYIIPVRPDNVPGRIGQQSSCFTLHMHGCKPVNNPTLISIEIAADSKPAILKELHRLNLNQFTAYYDLDHLSREINSSWGLET